MQYRPINFNKQNPSTATVTTADLSVMLGVSRATIHRMKCAGELPTVIPTKRRIVRWLAKDIELWLELDCPNAKDFMVYKRDLQRYTQSRKRRN